MVDYNRKIRVMNEKQMTDWRNDPEKQRLLWKYHDLVLDRKNLEDTMNDLQIKIHQTQVKLSTVNDAITDLVVKYNSRRPIKEEHDEYFGVK